jgi:hypothetical protein
MRFEALCGTEGARAMLGQKSIDSTQHYGVLDQQRVNKIARKKAIRRQPESESK